MCLGRGGVGDVARALTVAHQQKPLRRPDGGKPRVPRHGVVPPPPGRRLCRAVRPLRRLQVRRSPRRTNYPPEEPTVANPVYPFLLPPEPGAEGAIITELRIHGVSGPDPAGVLESP